MTVCRRYKICSPNVGNLFKIEASLLLTLFRQCHGDFCRYGFFPVYVTYDAGSGSLCDNVSRGGHTRSRWPWVTYHHRPFQHLSSHLEHSKEGTGSLESHVASWWEETVPEWQAGLYTQVLGQQLNQTAMKKLSLGKTYLLEITLSHKTQAFCVCWSFFIYCLLASKRIFILYLIL